jgi:hypothetical protein
MITTDLSHADVFLIKNLHFEFKLYSLIYQGVHSIIKAHSTVKTKKLVLRPHFMDERFLKHGSVAQV